MRETEEEQSIRFGTGILLFALFGVAITGLTAWIEFNNGQMAFYFLLIDLCLLGLTVWSLYHPFYPFVFGTCIYIGLLLALVVRYSKFMFPSGSARGPFSWTMLGLFLLLNATYTGFKSMKKEKRETRNE